jgi:spore coat polysaccharide biosynthesis protein SpsF
MDFVLELASKRTVGAIIQARVSSIRLPEKVLLPLPYGFKITVCEHIIRRLKKARSIDKIIVATSSNAEDGKIVNIANKKGVLTFQGDEQNVLSRFYEAAKRYNLDEIIRITADNPCVDYELVDSTVRAHLQEGNDYTITRHYPIGLNVEVISFKALQTAGENAKQQAELEHVTPYISKHQKLFKISQKKAPKIHRNSNIRVTLDTREDYALINCVFDFLYAQDNYFGLEKIIKLYRQKPWLAYINREIAQKKRFASLKDELSEAVRMLDMQELNKAKELLISHLK